MERPVLIYGRRHRLACRKGFNACASTEESGTSPHDGKKRPFRSWPISANELDDVASGAETNVKSPTVAVHSIFAVLRIKVPAKPP